MYTLQIWLHPAFLVYTVQQHLAFNHDEQGLKITNAFILLMSLDSLNIQKYLEMQNFVIVLCTENAQKFIIEVLKMKFGNLLNYMEKIAQFYDYCFFTRRRFSSKIFAKNINTKKS